VRELVNRKLYIPKISSECKDIKCISMEWWRKYKLMFPIIGFLASKKLRIVSFKIETERIISFVAILINLTRCHM
jgi:hypothetical protein